MPHHRRRDTANLQQTLQRAHLSATQAHVKLDVKDARIKVLEDDKTVKDTKVAELEADKSDKDTAMANLTARLATLENGNGGGGGGSSMTSEAVSWANLSEINLSGEKLVNTDFSLTEYVQDTSFTFPTPPHTFANPKPLAIAINGSGGLNPGEIYTIDRSREDNSALYLKNLSGSGQGWHGISTRGTRWEVVKKAPTNWSVKSGTLDQTKLASGIVDGAGGAVAIQQLFSSGIASGTTLVCKVTRNDINTGSVYINALRPNGTPWSSNFHIQPLDGYVEFTTTEIMYGLRLTTSHGTREVSSISLFQGVVSGGTVQAYAGGTIEKISGGTAWNAGASSVQKIGGNSDGYFQFQWAGLGKSQRVGLTYLDEDYTKVTPFQLTISGNGNTVVKTFNGGVGWATVGDWFRIRHYSADNTIHYQKRQAVGDGQEYVTFYTDTTLTNGNDLYMDTVLFNVGSQINDVTIVR